jgi:molecular chaperone GrpE (heat shock protein)
MSCYFRHLKDIFEEAGVEVTKENKKEIDRVFHELVEVEYKNCSPTWKAVKEQIKGDDKTRSRFIERFKRELKEQG